MDIVRNALAYQDVVTSAWDACRTFGDLGLELHQDTLELDDLITSGASTGVPGLSDAQALSLLRSPS